MKTIPVCFGAGLVALDVILNGSPATPPKLSAGGSCGNVISILSYLGWESYPVARLGDDKAREEILKDFSRWKVNIEYLTANENDNTPIIIHRILKDKNNSPIHRFEFRDPDTKSWLPQFKAITKNTAENVIRHDFAPQVFYFDRMNPGTFDLAVHLKAKGAVIFFEPSSAKDEKQFRKFLAIADVLKFSSDRIPDFRERFPTVECFLEIETLGKDGLAYRSIKNSSPNNWHSIKPFQLSNVQDAAGAGDWCSSGIISKLCVNGHSSLFSADINVIEDALNFGQALGALNCLYDGARGLMYHYSFENLLTCIQNANNSQEFLNSNDINNSPRIDISTDLSFSQLLPTI